MGDDLFWPLWVATVGVCGWKLVEGLRLPHRMLEWPFLACAMWLYFYGYMAYNAKLVLSGYLTSGSATLGQLMCFLSLLGVLVGWSWGTRIESMPAMQSRTYRYRRVWLLGFLFLVVGTVGGISVMRAGLSGTLRYEESSGYWYLLFYVGYPGLAMTVWALFKMTPRAPLALWIVTVIGLLAFMFPHVFSARRGPLFPAIMVLLLVPPLATRRSPRRLIFSGALLAGALAMLLFLQIRTVTYNGGSWGEALQNLNLDAAIEDRASQAEDNEYINNCQLIWTVCHDGKYQYGTGHLGLLFHWIPRSIWKDKPTLGEGTYSFDEMFDDVEAATGFHLLGTGAAAGGVADTFVQYGFFCPLFWLALSLGMGKAYVKARVGNSTRWIFCYVGFICATHWLVSQSFAAAFVPGMFFQVVPIVVFFFLGGTPNLATTPVEPARRRVGYPVRRRAVPT